MTSFALSLEPAAQPRLAASAFLVHLAAAGLPWIAGCAPGVALLLSGVALAGLPATLSTVPGPHHRLRRLRAAGDDWRVRAAASGEEWQVRPGPACRVFPGFVALDLRAPRRRLVWLLPRAALPPGEFRRLKARVRLAC